MEQGNFVNGGGEETIKPIKTYKIEYSEEGPKKVITNEEFRALKPEEIASRIYTIFEKIQHDSLIELDANDKFVIKDYISIVNNLSVDVGGPREFSFTLEIDGTLDELESEYQNALKEQIEELGLETDLFYALYNWDHEFAIYDKEVEKVNNNTPTKGMLDAKLIVDGQANK
jgi:hypothetical protein